MKISNISSIIFLAISIFFYGCKKLIEIDAPITRNSEKSVYSSDAAAISVMTGLYSRMNRISFNEPNVFTGIRGLAMSTGLSADELILYSGVSDNSLQLYYQNNLVAKGSSDAGSESWGPLYSYIFICNSVIEGLTTSSDLTPAIKKAVIRRGKIHQVFCLFLFGEFIWRCSTSTEYRLFC